MKRQHQKNGYSAQSIQPAPIAQMKVCGSLHDCGWWYSFLAEKTSAVRVRSDKLLNHLDPSLRSCRAVRFVTHAFNNLKPAACTETLSDLANVVKRHAWILIAD